MATENTKVTMSDGTSLEFNEKDKVKKLSSVTDEGIEIKFAFRTGVIKTCLVPFGSTILTQAALHGLNQKFGDSFAGVPEVDDCIEVFSKLAETIAPKESPLEGEWTQARVSDGMAGTSELARALVKVTGKPIDFVKTQLASLSKDEKSALRAQPPIVAAIAELKAAKPVKAGGTDGASVLAKFGAVATEETTEE